MSGHPFMILKNVVLSGRCGLVAAGIVAGLSLASLPAHASPLKSPAPHHAVAKSVNVHSTTMAARDPEATSSIRMDDDKPNCNRSRKKLWVEDEGWIVRQVTTCY
ncbi:hypothetical protein [Microvirga puerhi]|uniref:Uncharacterized protein n=1 Tax=Microvirga puerhi TaxID=2876078 RepID=A0ABS7VJ33_9HYPH|nr:hypothetical protein [Microvirga puerhi]MBZ6075515.1 hypothetical protein [Microvirga puerhi]